MIEEVRYDLDFDTKIISTQLNFQKDLGTFHSEPMDFDELGSIYLEDSGERDSLHLKIAIPTSVRSRNWPTELFKSETLNIKLPKSLKNIALKSWKISNAQGDLHYLYSENNRLVVGALWQDDIFKLLPKNSWGLQTLSESGNPKTLSAYLFGPTKTQKGGILILSDFGEAAFDVQTLQASTSPYAVPRNLLERMRESFLAFRFR